MPVAALENLPVAQARTFVPQDVDLNDWAQIEPLFQQLETDAAAIADAAELEAWIYRASELGSVLYQEEARRYINMTCQTDDEACDKAYLHFVEHIEPKTKPWWQKLDELYLACEHRKNLPTERWMVFDRDTKKDVEIYREANVPLQTDVAKLAQKYQKIMGAMTVTFQGEEQTLQKMARHLESTDRAVREEAWKLVGQRRLEDRDAIEDIYDELIKLRHTIGKNAGFDDFRGYAFKSKGRFDYTPADCEAYHDAVEACVVPLMHARQRQRAAEMKVDPLRPWDLNVDAKGRPPLRPFDKVEDLIAKTHAIFKRIDPDLGDDFNVLIKHDLLELESRKGKAPGGYQYSLEEARLPFIFMNSVGLHRDVETLLHEGGHAFHSLATRNEPLLSYRHAPMEFCEVASMSMELLAGTHLDEFYRPEEAARAQRTHIEGIVGLLAWIATIDAFQHWIYTHPEHTRDERKDHWRSLRTRFGGVEDWSGYDEALDYMWHRQGHLFGAPFYYIEYGIAQLGALQIWLNAQQDSKKAIADYRAALALGRSKPLPELFQTAGIRFDFGRATVEPLVQALQDELTQLEKA